MRGKYVLAVMALLVATTTQLQAGLIVNAGFDTGNLSGWSTLGLASVQGSSPSDYQALLSTGINRESTGISRSTIETFLGLASGSLVSPTVGSVIEGSALKQSFTGSAGDVLTFSWNFLTDDQVSGEGYGYNDFAFWSLANERGATVIADLFSPSVLSTTAFKYETGVHTVSYTLASSGTFTLGFGVVDVGDSTVGSGVLIDDVKINAARMAHAPEPSSLVSLASMGLVAGFGAWRRRRARRKAD